MLEVDEDSRLGAEILAFGKRYGAPEVPTEDQIADFYETRRGASGGHGNRTIRDLQLRASRFRIPPQLEVLASRALFGLRRRRAFLRRLLALAECRNGRRVCGPPLEADLPPAIERTAATSGEQFFLGLRLNEGVEADWSAFAPAVQQFVADGLIERDGNRLRLTPRGIMLSNEVFAEFV